MAMNDWHFPKETLDFLTDLAGHNDRDWFNAHKDTYEHAYRDQAEIFSELITAELEAITGEPHRAKIFRVYRDIRFSKDKTPYSPYLRMSFHPITGTNTPGWFFGLDPEKATVGGGRFRFEKGELDRYRRRVAGTDGEELKAIVEALLADGGRMYDPPLKRVPRPYDPDHPRGALLRRKGLAVWHDLTPAGVATKGNLIARCEQVFVGLKPLMAWFG